MFGKGQQLVTIALFFCLSVVSKVFEKLVNNRIFDHVRNVVFFLISSMVLDPLDQLKIFWQVHLIVLLGLLTSLVLIEL